MRNLNRRIPWTSRQGEREEYVPEGQQLCVCLSGPYDGRQVVLRDDCNRLDVYPLEDYHAGPDTYLRFGTMLICQLRVYKTEGK